MFEWPRFAAHLYSDRPPAKRIESLLADLAESAAAPSTADVLSTLFPDAALVDEIEALAPRIDHAGLIAPADLSFATITEMLGRSPFRRQLRQFRSAVLAKELSLRFGRRVEVMVAHGKVEGPRASCPSVEIFVADLPHAAIDELVSGETGCHVALALEANSSLGRVLEVLHAHGRWETPFMRGGPMHNDEIHWSVLYIDVPGRERSRRLEFIAPDTNGA